ncbi:AAA family ATPase [Streptomyces sp. NRRL S-87]|uniref:AAA family ATPase n=1 Tax=Streptomyces sp. NRRL S-87 TaxID=1463920 RepID=UPI00068F29AA|nr:AAA family ATPase [Streptomyces sp. NRRL S-87]
MFAVQLPESCCPLAGREAESERFAEALDALPRGRGTVVEIAGDPGIGKSLLLTLLARLSEDRGVQVARASGTRWPTTPYQVFEEALGDRPEAWPFPTHRSPGAPLLRAIRRQLADWVAAKGPCALLLDDVQLLDEESLALVVHLVRTPVPGPFVLAVAHRPRQTPAVLRDALDSGVRAGTVTRLRPEPLDRAAVAALLGHWHPDTGATACPAAPSPLAPRRDDPAEHADALHQASAGNPRGARILLAAGWQPDAWPDQIGPDRDGLLREGAALITELDALTPDAALAAAGAAVLGDRFSPEEVAEVSGLGTPRTLHALDELSRADLVRPLGRGGRFAFRSRVLGHVAHEHADPSFRLLAHRRALDLLTTRDACAAARARHAEHLVGTDSPTAVSVLAEGAAEVVGEAPATAARWLGLALQYLPGSDLVQPARATLGIAHCKALTAAGRPDEAHGLAHRLLAAAPHLPTDLRLRAHAACADVERQLGRYDEAEAVARAALDPLTRPLPPGAVELAFQYGLVHLLRGGYGQVRDLVREALRNAAGADEATGRRIRFLAGCGDAHLGLVSSALADAAECSRQVDALPDAVAAGSPELLTLLGCAELCVERFADARRHLHRGLAVTVGGARRFVVPRHQLWLSVLDQWTGRLSRAEHWAREAERYARSRGSEKLAGLAAITRAGALMWARGRRDAAEAVALAEHGACAVETRAGRRDGLVAGMLAQVRLLNGDAPGCQRTLLEGGGGEQLPLFLPPLRPWLLAMLAVAALYCRDTGGARRFATDAELAADLMGLPAQRAYAHRARGILHASDGAHDLALPLFKSSADAFREAGMPVQHAWTLVTGARSAAETIGPATALEWLGAAAAVSRGCGALRVRDEAVRVQKELASLGAVTGSPDGREVMMLLTEREREIARLAAAGKRSREIAMELFLSTRTVDAHLSRIYRKLDISSRAALASCFLQAGPNHF